MDGPVDLVGKVGGGGGGGVGEFVKKKFAEPQKGIKKFVQATLGKKNFQSKISKF